MAVPGPGAPDPARPVPVPPEPKPAVRAAEPEALRERRPGLTPLTLLLTLATAYVLYQVQLLLVLVALALVFATVIDKPVSLLERRRVPRPLGILLVYAAIIGGIALLITLVYPVIRDQAQVFRAEAPGQVRALQEAWETSPNGVLNGPGKDALGQVIAFVENPGSQAGQLDIPIPGSAAIGFLTGIGGAVISLLTIFVIAFYYLMEKSWLRRLAIYELPPESRARAARIWDSVEGKVGDWLRGQLVLCLVIGLTATIGYGLLGVRFWPLLGLWAGLTEIIPILGPWLGAIPAFIIALTQGWDKALLVVVFAVGLQLLENTVLVPRVMKGAVGLSAMTVFLAILAGTQFLGIPGAILAIPFAAAVQVVVGEWLDARKETSRNGAAPGWRWMRGPSPAAAPAAAPQPAAPPPVVPAPRWSHDVLTRLGSSRGARPADPERDRPS